MGVEKSCVGLLSLRYLIFNCSSLTFSWWKSVLLNDAEETSLIPACFSDNPAALVNLLKHTWWYCCDYRRENVYVFKILMEWHPLLIHIFLQQFQIAWVQKNTSTSKGQICNSPTFFHTLISGHALLKKTQTFAIISCLTRLYRVAHPSVIQNLTLFFYC